VTAAVHVPLVPFHVADVELQNDLIGLHCCHWSSGLTMEGVTVTAPAAVHVHVVPFRVADVELRSDLFGLRCCHQNSGLKMEWVMATAPVAVRVRVVPFRVADVELQSGLLMTVDPEANLEASEQLPRSLVGRNVQRNVHQCTYRCILLLLFTLTPFPLASSPLGFATVR
jgi:hypothetical protein